MYGSGGGVSERRGIMGGGDLNELINVLMRNIIRQGKMRKNLGNFENYTKFSQDFLLMAKRIFYNWIRLNESVSISVSLMQSAGYALVESRQF